MVDVDLLNFQDSLNNQQVMSKFKPSNFGIKFEHILMDILDPLHLDSKCLEN